MTDYWSEDEFDSGVKAKDDDDDDDFAPVSTNSARSTTGGIDLEAKGTLRTRMLGAEEIPPDYQGMTLVMEAVNSFVDRQKLTDSSLMRLVTKIATSAPAKGREKRQIVVLTSTEFAIRAAPNPATTEFTEVGRTDISLDDPSPTFTLPVRVLCRKGTDRLVRIQLLWSSSNIIVGGETVLGQATERFSDFITKTAEVHPYTFSMASAACPKGKVLAWRIPYTDIQPPSSPYIDMASRRHVSYSVPFVFRSRQWEDAGGPTAAGSSKGRRGSLTGRSTAEGPKPVPDDAPFGAEDLVLTRETAIESRFSYRAAALIFRPFIKQMEESLAAWNQRYEHERIAQGFFVSEAEAYKHGRVLVRLTVVEASNLPIANEREDGGKSYFSGLVTGRASSALSSVSQQAQKLARSKAADRMIACNSFVGVNHEKPRPQLGVLIGHTNTEYSNQAPVYGSNANIKLCQHKRPRESYSICGSTRLTKASDGVGQSFLFYAHKSEVDTSNLRFEVFQEVYSSQDGVTVQLSASANVLLDSYYAKTTDDGNDIETWLPLLDRDDMPCGRLLVRLAVFASPNDEPAGKGGPLLLPNESITPCYEWMKQAGLSGRLPREWDIFATPAPTSLQKPNDTERVLVRYPLDWLKRHIESMTKQLQVLQTSVRLWEQAVSDGRGFRSSDHKTTPELQGVPTNVHSQTFVVIDAKSLGGSSKASSVAPQSSPPIVHDLLSGEAPSESTSSTTTTVPSPIKNYYDLISCGAPTAHALGFRRGGLLSHQLEMAALQKQISVDDESLKALGPGPFLPTGPSGELHNDILPKLLKLEAMAAKTAVRRALVISQALTIATTSLATKLDVMLTEDADHTLTNRTADNITKGGFLVCFQGLVSTIGKEMGMLEDVAIAMELVSQYTFEVKAKNNSSSNSSTHTSTTNTTTSSPSSIPADAISFTSPIQAQAPASDDLLDFGSPFDSPPPPSSGPPAIPKPSNSSSSTTMSHPPTAPPTRAHSSVPNNGGELSLDVEYNHVQRRVCILLEPAALERLPNCIQSRAESPVVFPIVAILFAQGIDAKQSIANFSNQLKPTVGGGATTGGSTNSAGGNSTLQPIINRRSLKVLNDYCHRCYPLAEGHKQQQQHPQNNQPPPASPLPFLQQQMASSSLTHSPSSPAYRRGSSTNPVTTPNTPTRAAGPPGGFDRFIERYDVGRVTNYGTPEDFSRSIDEIYTHPMLEGLKEALKRDTGSHKNVELLHEQERVVLEVGGGQVIFCKSGKDRTGMAVTLHQARILGDRHGCGGSWERLVRDANLMRVHGTRLLICDKNVGRLKYAFNQLQLQFMPSEYRPPTETIEDMVNSILNRDTT